MLIDTVNNQKSTPSNSIKSNSFTLLKNMESLVPQYEGFLFDIWGVIHDGIQPFPRVVPLINDLIRQGKKIIFLSNAPRPGSLLIEKLIHLGIEARPGMILSSGDLVREQLKSFSDPVFKTLNKRFYHFGANRNKDILSGLNVDLTDHLEEANFVLLTAYLDEDEDLNQHDEFLKKALHFNLPFICANPDQEVLEGNKLRYCSGMLAEKYEKLGGRMHYYGKPYPDIYENAIQILQSQGIFDKKKILMIGDSLETDIKGAVNVRLDSALVLTGNFGRRFYNMKDDDMLSVETQTQTQTQTQTETETENQIEIQLETQLENQLNNCFKHSSCYPTWVLKSLV